MISKKNWKTNDSDWHIDGSECQIYSFVGGIPKKLRKKIHMLIYVWDEITSNGTSTKVGMVLNVNNKTVEEAIAGRYKSDKTSRTKDNPMHFRAVFICPNGIDDVSLRKFLYKRSKMFFPVMDKNNNTEIVMGLNWDVEKSKFEFIKKLSEFVGELPSQKYDFNYLHSSQEKWVTKCKNILFEFKRCLVNVYTGGGKSTCMPKIISEVCDVGDVCFITTPIKDTIDSFVSAVENLNYDKPMIVIQTHEFDNKSTLKRKINKLRKNCIVIIVSTVQAARYNDGQVDYDTLREKFELLSEIKLKVWIRDEYHIQYNAHVTSSKFENVNSEYLLDLTATTGNLLLRYGSEYSQKQILRYDNVWVIEQKRKGNKDFQFFPDVNIRVADFSKNVESSIFKSEENYTSEKIFEYNTENGKLVHKKSLSDLIKLIFDSTYNGETLSEKKNPFNPLIDSSLNFSDIGLMVVPRGKGAQQTINSIVSLINEVSNSTHAITAKKYLSISKKLCGDSGKIEKYLLNEMRKHDKQSIIIVTHKQLRTGTNIPRLSYIFCFDKISSSDEFTQLFGRLCRQYIKDGEIKNSAVFYGMAEGMELSLSSFQYSLVKEYTDDEKQQYELFDCMSPMVYFTDGTFKKVDFVEAESNNQKFLNKVFDLNCLRVTDIDRFNGLMIEIECFAKSNPSFKTRNNVLTKNIITDKTGGKNKKIKNSRKTSSNNNSKKIVDYIKKYLIDFVGFIPIYYCISLSDDIKNLLSYLNENNIIDDDHLNLILCCFRSEEFLKAVNVLLENCSKEFHDDTINFLENNSINYSDLFDDIPLSSKKIDEEFCSLIEGCPKSIAVLNCVNASLVLKLKSLFPNSKIVNIVQNDLFNNLFNYLDVDVVNFDNVVDTFDLVVGIPKFSKRIGVSAGGRKEWERTLETVVNKFLNFEGQLILMHPSGWRKAFHKCRKDIHDTWNLNYLNINFEKKNRCL